MKLHKCGCCGYEYDGDPTPSGWCPNCEDTDTSTLLAEGVAHTETTNLTTRPLCDLCKLTADTNYAVADAMVSNGRWAYVCPWHFSYHLCELGLGKGQLLIIDDGVYADEISQLRNEAV